MQEPSFWRDLRLEFQGLPDPVWSHTEAPGRLQASGPDIGGGDSSLRAQFRHLATHGGVALGVGRDDALRVWLATVWDYLTEERSPWCTESQSERWEGGPIEKRELTLSAIRPQPHRRHASDEDHELTERVDAIRRNGPKELLIVTADDPGYVVLDDECEHLTYRACVLANVTSLTCGVRAADNPGALREVTFCELDCISMASADLCRKHETEAFALQTEPPVGRPVMPAAGSAPRAPVSTPQSGPDRVDDFLERCNREHQGSGKLLRKDIWTLARHKTPRQFQYWQRGDQKASLADNVIFERILKMTPRDFINAVVRKRSPR